MVEGNMDSTITTNVRKGTFILLGFYTLTGTNRHEALDQGVSRTPTCAFQTFSDHFYIYFLAVDMEYFQ